ncbi:MAG TPA: hypothetical protein PK054_06495 [Anaerohalosphaeraceae bacterium]|nr:hypothetical protein [Anaerohalosphaeraceae bacterium]HOL88634.1 hypothetical protein [Anaerohalosphaeraceae bacterium]HPP56218.1 hypothetical protein [Anaerohalosphaeraceae bacterium]
MHQVGDFIPILSGIESLLDEFAEIIVLAIFAILTAVGNALKKKAEKKEQELRESEIQNDKTITAREKPTAQRKPPRQYQRLPYTKISDKPTVQRSQKLSRPTSGREAHSLPVASLSRLPQESVKPEKIDVAESAVPRAKPIEMGVLTTPSKPAVKSEKLPVQAGIDIRLLRQMLKNPKQMRYLVAASEILGKPLALR